MRDAAKYISVITVFLLLGLVVSYVNRLLAALSIRSLIQLTSVPDALALCRAPCTS